MKVERNIDHMELLSGLIMSEKDDVLSKELMKLYVDLERVVDKIDDFLYKEYDLILDNTDNSVSKRQI